MRLHSSTDALQSFAANEATHSIQTSDTGSRFTTRATDGTPTTTTCLRQQQYKKYFDRNTRTLPPLQADDVVRINHDGEWLRGRVLRPDVAPRSYVVEVEEGSTLRRNRRDLLKTAEETPVCAPFIEDSPMTQNASPSLISAPPSLTSVSSPSAAADPEDHLQRAHNKAAGAIQRLRHVNRSSPQVTSLQKRDVTDGLDIRRWIYPISSAIKPLDCTLGLQPAL